MLSGKNSQAINIFNGNILDGKNVNFNYKKSLGVPPGFFLLSKAANYCSYSQEYLSLLARKGELKSMKFGRNWYTTLEWLQEYTQEHAEGTKGHNKGKMFLVTSAKTDRQEETAVFGSGTPTINSGRVIRIIINGVNILSESLKEIFTFERKVKKASAVKQTKRAGKNYSVFSSKEKWGEEQKILVKQAVMEEIVSGLEKRLERTKRIQPETIEIKTSKNLIQSPSHNLNIRIVTVKNGKQEYFDLEPEVDWPAYAREVAANYWASRVYRFKSFFTDGIQQIKNFWHYWQIVPTIERWEFGMSLAVIFVCLLSSLVATKSESLIVYDREQIAQLVETGGEVVDKKLAWVADAYAERKKEWWSRAETKSSEGIIPVSREAQESGTIKMVAGAQVERARILEPGEEKVVLTDRLNVESLGATSQEVLPGEEENYWWKRWASKAVKIWTGLVVVEHESGAKYYKPPESEINNSPPGEMADLIGRGSPDSQTTRQDYLEENKIIFYQDENKGRSDNEKKKQEFLIGETANNNPAQSDRAERVEEIYFLLPLQE